MSARYTLLPNPRSAQDAEQEMVDAFALDEEDGHDDHETTPLTRQNSEHPSVHPTTSLAQTSPLPLSAPATGTSPAPYDFEREYDFPPPGSPPRPTDRALPNDFGNSNGILPTSPVERPAPRQQPWFQRIVGAVLPTRYSPVATSEAHGPTGGGTENDGVFSNVTAKPQRGQVVRSEDGSIYVMPEETQKEAPPSYLEAQADAVPTYWETTVHAPAGFEPGGAGEVIVDDLPTGSFLIFCLNCFISYFFSLAGFLLTYLLHTSHAAKYGSRAGLGLTLIKLGFDSRLPLSEQQAASASSASGFNWITEESDPSPSVSGRAILSRAVTAPIPDDSAVTTPSKEWLSFLFMMLGWFILITSVIGFWRVKRWENSIRNPPAPPTPEQMERDRHVRQTLEEVFGVPMTADETNDPNHRRTPSGRPAVVPSREVLEEARLTRDLHAAGLL